MMTTKLSILEGAGPAASFLTLTAEEIGTISQAGRLKGYLQLKGVYYFEKGDSTPHEIELDQVTEERVNATYFRLLAQAGNKVNIKLINYISMADTNGVTILQKLRASGDEEVKFDKVHVSKVVERTCTNEAGDEVPLYLNSSYAAYDVGIKAMTKEYKEMNKDDRLEAKSPASMLYKVRGFMDDLPGGKLSKGTHKPMTEVILVASKS
jgi:hypothetical protein